MATELKGPALIEVKIRSLLISCAHDHGIETAYEVLEATNEYFDNPFVSALLADIVNAKGTT